MKETDKPAYKTVCHTVREDGVYIEAGENDNLMGTMQWRGVTVPVLSFEKLVTGSQPHYGRRSKVCVFYPWKGADKEQFFAIASIHVDDTHLSGNVTHRQSHITAKIAHSEAWPPEKRAVTALG